jgi:hypothetical protein
MAVAQDEQAFIDFLQDFENLWPEILANISLKQQEKNWIKLLQDYSTELQAQNHGVAVEPDLTIFLQFSQLVPKDQHYWTDRCHHDCKKILQKQTGVLLQVCSWNPKPGSGDHVLGTADEQKRCLYGTLGVMAPDVLCLQEPIWVAQNFMTHLLRQKPDNYNFIFHRHWRLWAIEGNTEVAIFYDPRKLRVNYNVACKVNNAWRVRVQSLRATAGRDNDWRRVRQIQARLQEERMERLEDRTVALQGKVVSPNREVIIVTIHMFSGRLAYSDGQIQTLSTEVVSQAQELANERNMTVILCGDWNCKVFKIKLTAGAYRPDPLNHFGRPERGKVDSMIIINPVRVEARAGTAAGAEAAAGAAAEPGAARAVPEPGAAGAARDGAAAAPKAHKLTLDKVEFFRWTDNVTAADMGGLLPGEIDELYSQGGHHRPIVANIKATSSS